MECLLHRLGDGVPYNWKFCMLTRTSELIHAHFPQNDTILRRTPEAQRSWKTSAYLLHGLPAACGPARFSCSQTHPSPPLSRADRWSQWCNLHCSFRFWNRCEDVVFTRGCGLSGLKAPGSQSFATSASFICLPLLWVWRFPFPHKAQGGLKNMRDRHLETNNP